MDAAINPPPPQVTALHHKCAGAPCTIRPAEAPHRDCRVSELRDLNSYSHCLWLLEFSHLLNVVHEVPAVDVFHDEVQPVLWAKG